MDKHHNIMTQLLIEDTVIPINIASQIDEFFKQVYIKPVMCSTTFSSKRGGTRKDLIKYVCGTVVQNIENPNAKMRVYEQLVNYINNGIVLEEKQRVIGNLSGISFGLRQTNDCPAVAITGTMEYDCIKRGFLCMKRYEWSIRLILKVSEFDAKKIRKKHNIRNN